MNVFSQSSYNFQNAAKWIDVQMQWGAKCKMWPSAKIIKFVYKMAKLINGQKQWVAKWITNQLKNRCAENSESGGFTTFPRWRSRVFFNRTSLAPRQIFYAHLLESTDLNPSIFDFSVGFISRSCSESDGFIAYSNEWDWREKKRCLLTLINL